MALKLTSAQYAALKTIFAQAGDNTLPGSWLVAGSVDASRIAAALNTLIALGTTAYSWGNHALVGYLTFFTETDPVYSSSPASGITAASLASWNTSFSWGNHASAGYLTLATTPLFRKDTLVAVGGEGSLTLTRIPLSVVMVSFNLLGASAGGLVWMEGAGNDYTVAGNTVTFSVALVAGDEVQVYYLA